MTIDRTYPIFTVRWLAVHGLACTYRIPVIHGEIGTVTGIPVIGLIGIFFYGSYSGLDEADCRHENVRTQQDLAPLSLSC